MERTGTLSYMGMYDYDNTLFDTFQLPAGVDKDNLIISLLSECAELEALYPSAPTFKKILGAWSANRLPSWERVKAAFEAEYSPIENTDRYEDITDTTDHTANGTEKWTDSSTNKANATNQVNAYNDGIVDHDKSNTEGTGSGTHDGSDSTTEKTTYKHVNHTHGNIGVTTNQQMIKEEIELRQYDIDDYIINDFIKKFCITVY